MLVDVGAGDGRSVIAAAARDPATLVIGFDAAAGPMAEASRRAAAPAERGGLSNALFVVAGIEAPPAELVGSADLVTVAFPWGSLLRGVLAVDGAAAHGLGALLRANGRIEALVSIVERDRLDGLPELLADRAALDAAWAEQGFRVEELRPAGVGEIAMSGSTWAKRLGARATDGRSVIRLVVGRLPQDGSASSKPSSGG